jgi:hypothetical protein
VERSLQKRKDWLVCLLAPRILCWRAVLVDVLLICFHFIDYLWFLTQFSTVFQSSNCVRSKSDKYVFLSSVVYLPADCVCSVFDRHVESFVRSVSVAPGLYQHCLVLLWSRMSAQLPFPPKSTRSFSAVIVSLLLLCSGDTELNPGQICAFTHANNRPVDRSQSTSTLVH